MPRDRSGPFKPGKVVDAPRYSLEWRPEPGYRVWSSSLGYLRSESDVAESGWTPHLRFAEVFPDRADAVAALLSRGEIGRLAFPDSALVVVEYDRDCGGVVVV